MAFSITRRLDRLERAQPRAGSYLLARNDGETLIKLAASPPVVSFDGGLRRSSIRVAIDLYLQLPAQSDSTQGV